MSAITEKDHFDEKLTLFNPSGIPLTVHLIELALTKEGNSLSECCITFQISPDIYQQIDTEALFNLKPELRGPFTELNFQANQNIKILAILQPQILSQLQDCALSIAEASSYLFNLSQEYLNKQQAQVNLSEEKTELNPLLCTESWFALSVKQIQEAGEIGYRTFWSYVNPSLLTQETSSSGQVSEAMTRFFKDWAEVDMTATEAVISEAFEEMIVGLEEWAETSLLSITEEAFSVIFDEASRDLEDWLTQQDLQLSLEVTSEESIYQAIVNFFSEEDWEFTKLKGETTLRLAAKGKNGQWDCYARAINEPGKFVFYSVCPVKTPEIRRLEISEFLARVNYGLILGNFEFNFDSGEIRYKTSMDAANNPINSAALKQLVYTNVSMMDSYLPGIMAVIDKDLTPQEAIALVEA